jgi:hypothetical protein
VSVRRLLCRSREGDPVRLQGDKGRGVGGGSGTARSQAEGGAATPPQARRRRAVHVLTLHGEEIGEGKGADRWAGATVPRFEWIQTGHVIQNQFEFKF